MRFVFLVIVLGFPLIDLYATVRIARWTGIPVWAWLGMPVVGGIPPAAQRAAGVSREDDRGDARRAAAAARAPRQRPQGAGGGLLLLPGVISDLIALRAARPAAQPRAPDRGRG